MSLEAIQKPIERELHIFEEKFKEAVRSRVALLDKVMYYIVQRKGKQMRPMFVLFAAKLNGNDGITEATYRGAALIELLHTATLVHDDVVDDAEERRGFFSVNALWKNKIAVLVGDYLLSKGLLLSVDNGDFRLLQIAATAVREMSEGELLQMEKSRLLNLNENDYYDIIRRKTASLIVAACGIGYASGGGTGFLAEQLSLFAEYAGIAFQMKDDLFDYGNEKIGKPTGIDIREKKLTLPLIYTLSQAGNSLRKRLLYLTKNKNNDTAAVQEVINAVWKSGGIEYAQKAMEQYRHKALEALYHFPASEGRNGLEQLMDYTISRKK